MQAFSIPWGARVHKKSCEGILSQHTKNSNTLSGRCSILILYSDLQK